MKDVKYYCFIHFSGFKVVSRWGEDWIVAVRNGLFRRIEMEISNEDVARLAGRFLSWIETIGSEPVRLERSGRYMAFDAMLFNLPFEKFLMLENLWQGYISTMSNRPLNEMAKLLYSDAKGRPIADVPEAIAASVVLWFSAFKNMCYERWPNLYSKGVNPESGETVDVNAITNMQIRALTGGDITKEREVLAMDVWRALTELDAKAFEAAEQRRQIDKMKSK